MNFHAQQYQHHRIQKHWGSIANSSDSFLFLSSSRRKKYLQPFSFPWVKFHCIRKKLILRRFLKRWRCVRCSGYVTLGADDLYSNVLCGFSFFFGARSQPAVSFEQHWVLQNLILDSLHTSVKIPFLVRMTYGTLLYQCTHFTIHWIATCSNGPCIACKICSQFFIKTLPSRTRQMGKYVSLRVFSFVTGVRFKQQAKNLMRNSYRKLKRR